ncbi:MAG: pitrilysin family protein [Candidatus Margulisbacteria bacterium]|nr:pitrilysin family protein [Candidatus Margulisiibacteriota bacterium]
MYRIEKLPNGLTIVLESIPFVKSISLGLFVSCGSGNESLEQNGISHFVEHMNFKGTKTRSAKDIAEILDSVGGKLNAYTSKEHTSYYTTVLDEHFDIALDLMTDIFFNSIYRETDIITEKKVVLEEIKMYEDSPDEIVHDLFVRNIWPNYNLGQPVIGDKKVIENINRESILEYLKHNYIPENIIISVAGRFKMDEMIGKLKKVFSAHRGIKKVKKISYQPIFKPACNLIEKDTEQVHFCFGSRGVSYHDKERYPLLVLSSIIGGSMSSILFQEIREKRGLVYSIFSYPLYFKNCGLFVIYAGAALNKARQVLEIIVEKMNDLKKDIPDKMIHTAREQLKGGLVLGLESSSNKMSWNGKNYFYYEKYVKVNELFKVINNITKDELLELMNMVFNPNYYALTALGRFKEKDIFSGLL